jgi:lysophospholipase L1-like esterase
MSSFVRLFRLGLFTAVCALCAVPIVRGLPQRKLTILMVGDSIIAGEGDSSNRGGVVGRLKELFPELEFHSAPFPGHSSVIVAERVRRFLVEETSSFTQQLKAADVVLISVGMNDFWRGKLPLRTVENIEKLSNLIRSESLRLRGTEPVIGITTFAPTTHTGQHRWARDVNKIAISGVRKSLPGVIRYDRLPVGNLSRDGLHPSSVGYDFLSDLTQKWLCSKAELHLSAESCNRKVTASPQTTVSLPVTNREKRLAKRRAPPPLQGDSAS